MMDSRLRGDDGGERENDGGELGNDGGERGNDGGGLGNDGGGLGNDGGGLGNDGGERGNDGQGLCISMLMRKLCGAGQCQQRLQAKKKQRLQPVQDSRSYFVVEFRSTPPSFNPRWLSIRANINR